MFSVNLRGNISPAHRWCAQKCKADTFLLPPWKRSKLGHGPVCSAHYNLTPNPVKRHSCRLIHILQRAWCISSPRLFWGFSGSSKWQGSKHWGSIPVALPLCHDHHRTHRLLMESSTSRVILMSGFIKASAHAGGPCHTRVYILHPVLSSHMPLLYHILPKVSPWF